MNLHVKLTCVNSYNTYYYYYTNLYWSTIGRHNEKTFKFRKKGFPLETCHPGMCTFSTKTLRHWRMQFETLAHTISCLSQDTIRDSRLKRIHFHSIASPYLSFYSCFYIRVIDLLDNANKSCFVKGLTICTPNEFVPSSFSDWVPFFWYLSLR
jgi:hypothetical protein